MIDKATEKIIKLNKATLQVATKVVEDSLEAGEKWQLVLEKGLEGGVQLLAQQQNLVFDSLEQIKNQTIEGSIKTKKLLDLPTTDELADKFVMVVVKGTEQATRIAGEITKTVGDITGTNTSTKTREKCLKK